MCFPLKFFTLIYGTRNATPYVATCQAPFRKNEMRLEPLAYNDWYDATEQNVMRKMKVQLKNQTGEGFGERLAGLRQAAGYSQRELAAETGISHRMIAYYEKEAGHIPIDLLPVLTKTLNVSADQLLGIEKVKTNGRTRDTRLWRRFAEVEKLPPSRRRPVVQLLDAFLKSERVGNG